MIAFTAIGHMIRDGFPALGSTHAARLAGGAAVFLGLWIVTGWVEAAILAAAVTAGFYTDAQHGEANRGNWVAGTISGCTSIAPLAVAAAGLHMNLWWLLVLVVGALKPPIWQAAWAIEPYRWRVWVPEWAEPLFEPTRVAAVAWGVTVGGVLCAVSL